MSNEFNHKWGIYGDVLGKKEKAIDHRWREKAIENNRLWQEARHRWRTEKKRKGKEEEEARIELVTMRSEMEEQGYTLWRDLPWIKYQYDNTEM